jgi:hypothetical protein
MLPKSITEFYSCYVDADDYDYLGFDDFKIANYNEVDDLYFFMPYCQGSDYSGSLVEKANYTEFLALYEGQDFVHKLRGGYYSYGIAINIKRLKASVELENVVDIIKGLDNYPLINDEAFSELEMVGADEAWGSWAESEFKRELEKKFPDIEFEWPSDLRVFFEEKSQEANEYWFNEGSGPDMYIDIGRVVEGIDLEDLDDYIVKYEVLYMDVGQETKVFLSEQEAIEFMESVNDRYPIIRKRVNSEVQPN